MPSEKGPRAAFVEYTGKELDAAALESLGALLASGATYVEARDAIYALRALPAGTRANALGLLRAVRRKANPDQALAAAESRANQEPAADEPDPDGGQGTPDEAIAAWDAHRAQPPAQRAAMTRLLRAVARRRAPAVALARIVARVNQEPEA